MMAVHRRAKTHQEVGKHADEIPYSPRLEETILRLSRDEYLIERVSTEGSKGVEQADEGSCGRLSPLPQVTEPQTH
jgi:hypothetical protein